MLKADAVVPVALAFLLAGSAAGQERPEGFPDARAFVAEYVQAGNFAPVMVAGCPVRGTWLDSVFTSLLELPAELRYASDFSAAWGQALARCDDHRFAEWFRKEVVRLDHPVVSGSLAKHLADNPNDLNRRALLRAASDPARSDASRAAILGRWTPRLGLSERVAVFAEVFRSATLPAPYSYDEFGFLVRSHQRTAVLDTVASVLRERPNGEDAVLVFNLMLRFVSTTDDRLRVLRLIDHLERNAERMSEEFQHVIRGARQELVK